MIATVAGVIVGAVVCLAGAAKIASGDQWKVQARAMGAPQLVVPFVPWIEILVGAALVARVTPMVSGSAALMLLVAFTFLILMNLSRGQRPVCACFGAWRPKPLGWKHVARNVLLVALTFVSLWA